MAGIAAFSAVIFSASFDSQWLFRIGAGAIGFTAAGALAGLWGVWFGVRKLLRDPFDDRERRGVLAEIRTLSTQLVESPAWDELFGDLSRWAPHPQEQNEQLLRLQSSVTSLRQSLAEEDRLGGRRTPVRSTCGIEAGTGS